MNAKEAIWCLVAHITHFQFTEFSAIIILQRRAGETVEVTAKKD